MRKRNIINDPQEGVATSTMEKVRAVFGLGLGASCALAGGAAVFYVCNVMHGTFIYLPNSNTKYFSLPNDLFLQSAACYTELFDGASIDVELPHHSPSLLSSYPLLNNVLLLLIFFVTHRSVTCTCTLHIEYEHTVQSHCLYIFNFDSPLFYLD